MVLNESRRLSACAALLVAGLLVGPAAAQYESVDPTGQNPNRKDEGKALADRGFALFQQGDYATAIELFNQAEQIVHSPMILNFLAESHERLGKLVEAKRLYEQLADEQLPALAPPAQRKTQAEARSNASMLGQRIPRAQVEITGVPLASVKVTLDGKEVTAAALATPLQMNPGKHVLNVTAPDREPVVRTFDAEERQLTTFALHFAPVPDAPEAEQKVTIVREEGPELIHIIGPSAAYGVGAAGLGLGLVSGLMYLSRADSLTERCPEDRCIAELEEEKSTLTRLSTLSIVGFVVGGVGVTTGTLWWLLAPQKPERADAVEARYRPQLRVGPGSLQLSGTF
ncbi:MAG: CDC27 family protein [Deltaproteobacteria bacterium]|jgi:hypothetical protein|nr:CDC27 family protein [Deltaproteobacteria bacterium]MBW2536737.1 CDC27 family protein [Deltaproteobacteria bacterium]